MSGVCFHPAPEFEPIPVRIAIPGTRGTRSQRINPWMAGSSPAATVCKMSAGYQLLDLAGARVPTIKEVKLLASFPAGFAFAGSFADRWSRLGNCVPPLLSRAIATGVRRLLDASRS